MVCCRMLGPWSPLVVKPWWVISCCYTTWTCISSLGERLGTCIGLSVELSLPTLVPKWAWACIAAPQSWWWEETSTACLAEILKFDFKFHLNVSYIVHVKILLQRDVIMEFSFRESLWKVVESWWTMKPAKSEQTIASWRGCSSLNSNFVLIPLEVKVLSGWLKSISPVCCVPGERVVHTLPNPSSLKTKTDRM